MRRVEMIMGLPISVDIPDAASDKPFAAVFGLLRKVDRRFSPFKKTSELCQFQRGDILVGNLSADMQEVMDACQALQQQTGGYFSAYFAGAFDPTGYVKGWAIKRAGELLAGEGFDTYMINAGGDILARSNGQHIWRIGLQHPHRADATIGTVAAANMAVASSGTYARGQHIVDPVNNKPAIELLAATVTGPDIAMADALATAVFAMGKRGIAFIETQPGYEALVIGPDLSVHMSQGFVKTQSAR